MATQMKAWRFYGRRDLRLEEVKLSQLAKDEVLIQVSRAGVCQTDLDEFIFGPKLFNPLSLIPGHEFGGKVVDKGQNVSSALLGLNVGVLPLIGCGQCSYCQHGLINLCAQKTYYGIMGQNGGFAEYAVVKADNVFALPNPKLNNWLEILLTANHLWQQLSKETLFGKKVLILGAGPVGLVCGLLLRAYDFEVYLCEAREKRRELARQNNFETYSFLEEVKENSFDLFVDCAGEDPILPTTSEWVARILRPQGKLAMLGIYFNPIQLSGIELISKEIKLIPVFMYAKEAISSLQQLLEMVTGPLLQLPVHEFAWTKLVDILVELEINKDNYLKAVLTYAHN